MRYLYLKFHDNDDVSAAALPPKTQTQEAVEYYREKESKSVNPRYSKQSDNWAFMENTGKVLADIPDTWRAYPDTIKGRCDILEMEFREFQNAVTKEEKMHEIEHVGAAALHLWEALREAK